MLCHQTTPRRRRRSIRLANGIECELLHDASDGVRHFLEYISLDRGGEEVGPVEFQGEMSDKHKYALEYSVPDEHIRLVPFDSRKHSSDWKAHPGGTRTRVGVKFEPLALTGRWEMPPPATSASDETDAANIFGPSGTLHLNMDDFLAVPHYNALDVAETLRKKWDVRIVPLGTKLPPIREYHIMATYVLNDGFIKKWVHHKTNGPGVFIEHHRFDHMMTPADPTGHGSFVLGRFTGPEVRKRRESQNKWRRPFELVALTVPFGFTVVIPGGMLHCDWYFKGKLTTTLAMDEHAVVAFVRGRDNKRISYAFVEDPSR